MTKKDLESILKQLENGEFNEWAIGYSYDYNKYLSYTELLAIVKDFIRCRIIEKEK